MLQLVVRNLGGSAFGCGHVGIQDTWSLSRCVWFCELAPELFGNYFWVIGQENVGSWSCVLCCNGDLSVSKNKLISLQSIGEKPPPCKRFQV